MLVRLSLLSKRTQAFCEEVLCWFGASRCSFPSERPLYTVYSVVGTFEAAARQRPLEGFKMLPSRSLPEAPRITRTRYSPPHSVIHPRLQRGSVPDQRPLSRACPSCSFLFLLLPPQTSTTSAAAQTGGGGVIELYMVGVQNEPHRFANNNKATWCIAAKHLGHPEIAQRQPPERPMAWKPQNEPWLEAGLLTVFDRVSRCMAPAKA